MDIFGFLVIVILFDVLGHPVDGKGPVVVDKRCFSLSIHKVYTLSGIDTDASMPATFAIIESIAGCDGLQVITTKPWTLDTPPVYPNAQYSMDLVPRWFID